MFQFKQFAVDQSGCAMKINTDGVLLGAKADADNSRTILDIGTGTGVIALMLAQRFAKAKIDAVEIDGPACQTAFYNFANSKFTERLTARHSGFEEYFNNKSDALFDLIVSNPPFYINSLRSPGAERSKAKHADRSFFDQLINQASLHLTENGSLWLVLPIDTSELVQQIALERSLFVLKFIEVKSYAESKPHRHIIAFGKHEREFYKDSLVIYNAPREYSEQYRELLKPFFTIF